jgi:ATP-binding cassette subfamily C exporter for protease/lipase
MTVPTALAPARSEASRALNALRGEFARACACSLGANLLMLTPTLYMLQVYDRVLVSRSELTLLAVSLIVLVLFGVMALAEALRTRVLIGAGVRLDRLLAARVFDAGFDAALAPTPSAAPRPLADLIQLRQFLTGGGVIAFFDAPWVPIYIGVLWLLHPWLGALALVFASLQFLLVWFGHRRTVAPGEAAAASADAESAFMRQKLQGSEALEAMGMLGPLWARFQVQHRAQLGDRARLQGLTHRVAAFSKFVRYSQQSLVLGMGGLLVIDGQLTGGAMIAANVLMTRALAPIDMLVGSWRALAGARAAFARLRALLDAHPAAAAAPFEVALRGEVSLRGVQAHAAGRAAPILPGIDLDLAAGSVSVVVGPSGSGKSTLARVIAGAWPGVKGELRLDGRDAAEWPRDALGAQTGFLPQEIELFDGTIAENIARFGEVDSARVIAAASGAGLHESILRLPRGYDTPVGDAGMPLSGGQRQRIALARAVYGWPALVVLDEPNANLDAEGDAALATLVRALKAAGKTVLLVTHRPAILAVADRLLVMRDGRIEREGRPDDVVAEVRRAVQAPFARPAMTLIGST